MTKHLHQTWFCHSLPNSHDKTSGKCLLRTNLLPPVFTPAPAALEQAALQTECDLKMLTCIPASFMVCLSHLAIEEEIIGLCSPIQKRNK